MLICPHCGAENPDYSSFCSLCLARFTRVGEADNSIPTSAAHDQQQAPAQNSFSQGDNVAYTGVQGQAYETLNTPAVNQQPAPEPYVSPGDFHALQREMRQPGNPDPYRNSAYYQAAMQNPGSIHAAPAPVWMKKRSASDIALLVLKHSLIMFFVLIGSQFLVGILATAIAGGSIMQGSLSGVWIAYALMVITELTVIFWAGYRIATEAMERNKGWMYGAACVAVMIFVWQAIFSLILKLIGLEVILSIFNPVLIMLAVFLYIPLGALGGWVAERRYMG